MKPKGLVFLFGATFIVSLRVFLAHLESPQVIFDQYQETAFEREPLSFVALHLSAWAPETNDLKLTLVDLGSGKTTLLTGRPVIRHHDFNLTPHMSPGKKYLLKLSAATIEEFSLKKTESFPFLPLAICLLSVFLPLTLTAVTFIKRKDWDGAKKWGPLLLVLAIAVAARGQAWLAAFMHGLEGDAIGYYGSVSQLVTGGREPVYIWLQALMAAVLGLSPAAFRLAPAALSVGSVGLIYVLTYRLSKKIPAAFAAGLLMAVGEFAVINSVRGERAELFVFLVLAFSYGALFFKKSVRTEILLAVMGTLLSLTWLIGALTVLAVYLYRLFRQKIRWPQNLYFWCVWLVLVGLFLFVQWKQSGDAFHALNVHTGYYTGEQQTWIRFIFEEKGVFSVAKNVLMGYVQMFNPLNPFNKIFLGFHYTEKGSLFLYPFLLLGIFRAAREKQWEIFLLFFAVLHVSTAVLVHVRDPRLFLQAAPFFAYFFGLGVSFVALLSSKHFVKLPPLLGR